MGANFVRKKAIRSAPNFFNSQLKSHDSYIFAHIMIFFSRLIFVMQLNILFKLISFELVYVNRLTTLKQSLLTHTVGCRDGTQDSHSEIGAQVWSKFGNLICLRHLFRSTTVENLALIFYKRPVLHHMYTTCSEWPSKYYEINRIIIIKCTGWIIYYRKSVQLLLKLTWNMCFIRCSTDLR